jgi:hypothetical protein
MSRTPRSRISFSAPVTLTTTAETTISPVAVVGRSWDLFRMSISNASATGTKVTIRSATAAASPALVFWVAAGACVTFGAGIEDAMPQAAIATTANSGTNVWTAQLGTAVTDVTINAEFISNNA